MYRTRAVFFCLSCVAAVFPGGACHAQTSVSSGRRLISFRTHRAAGQGPLQQISARYGVPRLRPQTQETTAVPPTLESVIEARPGSGSEAVIRANGIEAAPSRSKPSWGPTTSGPFFTGTAEVEPMGSRYWEPYMLAYRQASSSSTNFNQKTAVGMGNNLEFDAQVPLILNTAKPPATPAGTTVSQFGPGDAHLNFKYQLTSDANAYKFLARPALSLTADLFIPSGNASGLRPSRYGVDQFGNGTFQEGMSLLIHKRAHPFEFYGQFGDLIEDPTHVSRGYGYNNGMDSVQSGKNMPMIDGNLLYYSAALEYVINTRRGIGLLAEVDGQSQSLRNLLFGKATAPGYSYLSAAPEVEYTWPAGKHFAITWGAGVNLPVERGDYPRVLTPMATLTFCFNGPNGGRDSQ